MNKKNFRSRFSPSSSSFRKKLLWSFLALLLVGGVLVVLEKTGVTNFIKLHHPAPASTSGVTAEQTQQENAPGQELKKQMADDPKGSTSSTTPDTASAKSVDLSAKTASNNTVTIFTTLKGYSDGTCLLTVTNNTKNTTQLVPVIYQPEASSCAGFSVPIDPLGKGTWAINLSVSSNGTSISKSINYEVK